MLFFDVLRGLSKCRVIWPGARGQVFRRLSVDRIYAFLLFTSLAKDFIAQVFWLVARTIQ